MQIVAWPRRSVRKPCPQTTVAVSPLSGVCAKLLGGTSCWAEPSALKPEIVDGSISQARTLHENAPHHGRFILQSGTLHAEARNCGRFHSSESNPPRFRPESRTVRCKQNQPSTRRLDITDGPCLRSAPSMLMLHFADGSILQDRTIHENAPHHGGFNVQGGTFRAEARNRGRFHFPGPNLPRGDSISRTVHVSEAHLPRKCPASWKVPFPRVEPSTF